MPFRLLLGLMFALLVPLAAAGEDEPPAEDEIDPLWPDGLVPDAKARQLTHAQRTPPTGNSKSPDGKWLASIKDGNVFVKDKEGKEAQLSKDGKAGNAYAMLAWSR